MDGAWIIPNWPAPWEPEFEVSRLRSLAETIEKVSPEITCIPDFSIKGCAFVEFYRGDVNIGRACVTRGANEEPFYSAYFGATGDEFHGFNPLAIASMVAVYDTSINDAPELDY
ncbi:hypothetical protein [Methylomagnum sp.]